MQPGEVHGIAEALGQRVVGTSTLAGGFSHETCLVTLTDGLVVARLGGSDPVVEAAVMAEARRYVPVPQVLLVQPPAAGAEGARPLMVLQHVAGTPLSQVLAGGEFPATCMATPRWPAWMRPRSGRGWACARRTPRRSPSSTITPGSCTLT